VSPLCPFCAVISAGDYWLDGGNSVAIEDVFPLSPGHTLVLPRRHEGNYFVLDESEATSMTCLARRVQALLTERYRPDGYNLGINVGAAAGQTIGHVHLHVIPRYTGDVLDPRGGVRWVIPQRAMYWRDDRARA
jgi:diadenosine tetraphosphate (Ap4A) HIT family hydrolase